ncbi:MAG: hypothetical protein ACKVS6_15600 [Planctomycetota bacterium]
MKLQILAALIIIITPAAACARSKSAKGPSGAIYSEDFEKLPAGNIPAAWKVGETHGTGTLATWKIAPLGDAPAGPNCLIVAESKNRGNTYNMCIFRDEFPANVTISCQVRATGGAEDQGGGVAWRIVNEDNYYLTRWNPLEKNLRAYIIENGTRKMLANLKIDAPADRWHRIEVICKDDTFVIFFDGVQSLEFDDSTLTKGGKAGVWSKADALTAFDGFTVMPNAAK